MIFYNFNSVRRQKQHFGTVKKKRVHNSRFPITIKTTNSYRVEPKTAQPPAKRE